MFKVFMQNGLTKLFLVNLLMSIHRCSLPIPRALFLGGRADNHCFRLWIEELPKPPHFAHYLKMAEIECFEIN